MIESSWGSRLKRSKRWVRRYLRKIRQVFRPQPSWLGIALWRDLRGSHVGLLFRGSDSEFYALHLADHADLRKEHAKFPNLWWVEPDLPETALKYLAFDAEQIAEENHPKSIPYGFDNSGWELPTDSWTFIRGDPGTGFTCATFVLEILKRGALGDLLDRQNWQQDDAEDRKFKALFVERLRNKLSPWHPHVTAMSARTNVFRFRPTDVAAGAEEPCSSWPVSFAVARSSGQEILAALRK